MIKTYKGLLFGLVMALGSTSAFAQVANTTNKVFIDQVGNSNTVTLTQSGSGNNIGVSSSDYATITGDSNTVTMSQTGDGNKANYKITGNGNTYTSVVSGNNNDVLVTCGTGAGACTGVIIDQTITGNGNKLVETIAGSAINSKTKIVGNLNDLQYNLLSSNGKLDVDISGDSNILRHDQNGSAGVNGHDLKVLIAGSLNQVTTTQGGTIDTTVNIKVNGGSNVINVTTSN
jgi:hypothetical protein